MQGSGWPANSVNSFWKCFSSGSYKFTITDAYGDGICCSYGNGGYSVQVDDKEVESGGPFGSKEEKTFNVVSNTDSPVAPPSTTPPVASPTTSAPISPTSPCTLLNQSLPCIQPPVYRLLSLPPAHPLLTQLRLPLPSNLLSHVKPRENLVI